MLIEDVALPGVIENPFTYMRQADMFVLSSHWEWLPTVLVEAMACGVPVISADTSGGLAEILENVKWGRLVPVGDVSALAQANAGYTRQFGPVTYAEGHEFPGRQSGLCLSVTYIHR